MRHQRGVFAPAAGSFADPHEADDVAQEDSHPQHQENQKRRILEYCGLPWEDQCLRFHEAGKKHNPKMSAAPTLSYSQVTKPIYRSSVGRADKFAPYLDSVREILGIEPGASPLGHDMRC